jgi:hypothetical protein
LEALGHLLNLKILYYNSTQDITFKDYRAKSREITGNHERSREITQKARLSINTERYSLLRSIIGPYQLGEIKKKFLSEGRVIESFKKKLNLTVLTYVLSQKNLTMTNDENASNNSYNEPIVSIHELESRQWVIYQ